ncbi:Lrp/AsnC family transcriptional regulator [Streptomyces griseoviridis]|uniref:AsnC family transcriptional regulator n=1 Tax=Streptomyces hintoniae TaxID=3075521 RepID=A0ABU2UTG5_9ACTN|nr:AsnC family transcriptional regulator [Streptomyces sp. DSM 41014]MDT0476580.1 AsnC family transcriptional regulator [Streptomyces sp. DSM 41014]
MTAPPPPLDTLDLALIQALQFDGRAPFSRIGAVLGVSDQTVARRYRRLRSTAGLRVVGAIDESRLGLTTWILRLGCTPDAAEQLAAALARRPDTAYIDLVAGGTEVMCAMRPRSRRDRDELLLGKLRRTPRVVSVAAHCLLHLFYGGALARLDKIHALTAEQQAALRPAPVEAGSRPVTLDPDDEALMALLRRDGRTPLGELRLATGQSESAVRRRLERLRSSGVLYFEAQHDHASLGQGIGAMLWLTVAPSALADVGEALASHWEVRFAAATTGPANLVASVGCADTGAFYRYLSRTVGALPGVRTVETALTLRTVKQLTYEPAR